MAGLLATFSPSSEIALVATVEKIVLSVTAPTNQRIKIPRWRITFDGNSAAADQSIVKLCKVTSTVTGTSVTAVKLTPGSETLQVVGKHSLSAGSVGDVLERLEVHPQNGYEVVLPLGSEYIVAGGETVGIAVTSAITVNCIPQIWIEE